MTHRLRVAVRKELPLVPFTREGVGGGKGIFAALFNSVERERSNRDVTIHGSVRKSGSQEVRQSPACASPSRAPAPGGHPSLGPGYCRGTGSLSGPSVGGKGRPYPPPQNEAYGKEKARAKHTRTRKENSRRNGRAGVRLQGQTV